VKKVFLVVFAVILMGCHTPFMAQVQQRQMDPNSEEFQFENLQELIIPPSYQYLFDEAAKCAKIKDPRPLYKIEWFIADSIYRGDEHVWGVFESPNRIILLRWRAAFVGTIKHEMLHYLIWPTKGHPKPPFMKCEI
jgi:hypothetical protein